MPLQLQLKMKTTTFLAIAASISGAVATFRQAPRFDCPRSIDNKCDDKQKSGFDWDDLNPGDFTDYHGFRFKGFKCEDKPDKRNPHLSPRTGRKALAGRCGPTKDVSPSFGCDVSKGIDKFSITHIDISVEFDTDLEFHYDMPDGKECKHRARCSKAGTTVENSQCGGAKNVTIVYPLLPKPPKPDCGISVHNIQFDCSPPESGRPPKDRPQPPKQTTTADPTTPEETDYETEVQTYTTTSTIYEETVTTITSCRPEIPNCPKDKPTEIAYVTVTVPKTTTVCPVTTTIKKPRPGFPRPTSSPGKPQPPVKLPELPCPDVVPSCLNTWLFTVGCLDNTDASCYCPDVAFVQNIFTCIYAYGQTDVIISQAVLFFQGICAPHAPHNPAIVTGAETITKVITVTAPTPTAVYTTLFATVTQVVPVSADGTTVEGSSTTTIYTQSMPVPEIGFQTGESGEVGLVATTPEAAVVEPTVTNAPTTLASVAPTGVATSSDRPNPVVVNGADKVGSRVFGLGVAVMAAIAAL